MVEQNLKNVLESVSNILKDEKMDHIKCLVETRKERTKWGEKEKEQIQ